MKLRSLALLLSAAGCSSVEHVDAPSGIGREGAARTGGDEDGSPDAAGSAPAASEAADPQRTFDPVAEAGSVGRGWPFAVGACPKGSLAVPASTFDESCKCRKPVFIGCAPEGAAFNSMATCYKRRSDGLTILTVDPVQQLLGSAWMGCTKDDWARAGVERAERAVTNLSRADAPRVLEPGR